METYRRLPVETERDLASRLITAMTERDEAGIADTLRTLEHSGVAESMPFLNGSVSDGAVQGMEKQGYVVVRSGEQAYAIKKGAAADAVRSLREREAGRSFI